MIEKINSIGSSSVYLDQGSSKAYFNKNLGGSYSSYFTFFKGFEMLKPSFEIDGGVTKIRKNEYNILTSISNNNIIPWFINPAIRTGSMPGPITMQLPNVDGVPGSFGMQFSNQVATITFAYYTQWITQYEDYSIGFDVEVIGTNVKKLRLNLNGYVGSFIVLNLETLTSSISSEIVSGNAGTDVYEILLESIAVNKYRVKCSYKHNNFFTNNERKLSVSMLPNLDINGDSINGSTAPYTDFQLFSGDGIIIDRYFSNKGVSKYNYLIGWTSDEEQTLSFDQSGGCPLAVGPSTSINERSSSTFVKGTTPSNDEGIWNQSSYSLLNAVGYENTNIPSIFYGEDAYKLVFLPGIINNEPIFNPPGVPAVTNSNTKLRAFTISRPNDGPLNNKVYCFSFLTKYVEPQSGDRIGRYLGISPFCDFDYNSIFKSTYTKTQGAGVNDLYFTTIDLKNKTVVGYAGGLDYTEDVEIINIPNSGGWMKIVYRCEVVDRSGSVTWNYALPVVALVNSSGIPQIEPSPLASDDYFIMEGLNTSRFRSFFDVQKNPLNTFNYLTSEGSWNTLQVETTKLSDLNVAFRYKGNNYSVFCIKFESYGGSQNGNFNIDESLAFVRGANKQYKLYHSVNFNGSHSSLLNGESISFATVNSVNAGNINFSDSTIICYRKDKAYHFIVNQQEFVLPVVNDIQKYYDISNGVRQDSLSGQGGLSAYINLFRNPSLVQDIPEFFGESQFEYFPSFCSNDKIGNIVTLTTYPTEVEIEILKSSL